MPLELIPRPAASGSRKRGYSKGKSFATYSARVFGAALIGIAIWGVWISKDVARLAGDGGVATGKHSASDAAFFLIWLVVFGPFLYFGVAILRSTFTHEGRAWLIPLRVFTYIVGLRAIAEMRRRNSVKKTDSKVLPMSGPKNRLGP